MEISKKLGGRPRNPLFETLGFTLMHVPVGDGIWGERRGVAECNVCKRQLSNTSGNRLKAHRNVCKANGEIPVQSEDIGLGNASESGNASQTATIGKIQNPIIDELGFVFQKRADHDRRPSALCLTCNKQLANTSVRRLKAHRAICLPGREGASGCGTSEDMTLVDQNHEPPSVKCEDPIANENAIDGNASHSMLDGTDAIVGRPRNTLYGKLGYIYKKIGLLGKQKPVAECLTCKKLLANTSTRRLIAHRTFCQSQITEQPIYDTVKEVYLLDRDQESQAVKSDDLILNEERKDGVHNLVPESILGETLPPHSAVGILFGESGFLFQKTGPLSKPIAKCLACNVFLVNTTENQLKEHRNSCAYTPNESINSNDNDDESQINHANESVKQRDTHDDESNDSSNYSISTEAPPTVTIHPRIQITKMGFVFKNISSQQGQQKRVVQCLSCKKHLANTSLNRVKAHRNICVQTNYTILDTDYMQKRNEIGASDATVADVSTDDKAMPVFERSRNRLFERLGFVLKRVGANRNAVCLMCCRELTNTSSKRLRKHRIICELGESASYADVEKVILQNKHTDYGKKRQEKMGALRSTLCEAKSRNPLFAELGFTLKRAGADGYWAYFAECSICGKQLTNSAVKRLKMHRNVCGSEKTNESIATANKDTDCNKSDKKNEIARTDDRKHKHAANMTLDEALNDQVDLKEKNPIYKQFGFVRKTIGEIGDRKYVAHCLTCERQLKNTSAARLKTHRKICQVNEFDIEDASDMLESNSELSTDQPADDEGEARHTATSHFVEVLTNESDHDNIFVVAKNDFVIAINKMMSNKITLFNAITFSSSVG